MSKFPVSWPRPDKTLILHGKYVRLEPVQLSHASGLHKILMEHDAPERLKYLLTLPPSWDEETHKTWLAGYVGLEDPFIYVVIDQKTNEVVGRHSLMRITPDHGVIEIGGVLWGNGMARSRLATEALFLSAQYIFDVLHYRRFEWKCDNDNAASKRAAERFGFQFEGIFRQHQVVKGRSRDTAWYAMMDHEWPELKHTYEQWLNESNFDDHGHQKKDLRSFR